MDNTASPIMGTYSVFPARRITWMLLSALTFLGPNAAHADDDLGAAARNFGRAVRDAGKAVGQGARHIGRQTKGPAREVGHGFRDGAVAAGHGFRDGFGKGGKAAGRGGNSGGRTTSSKAGKHTTPAPALPGFPAGAATGRPARARRSTGAYGTGGQN
jgi:hypothetical protein